MRRFNTAGPCEPDRHYMVEPLGRLPEARGLVAAGSYFVVHAPRQTGKTTTLRALAKALSAEGEYLAVHLSCELGAAFPDDVGAAEDAILESWRLAAITQLPPELCPRRWGEAKSGARLGVALTGWAQEAPRRLVLVLDEIDALRDSVLISVLRQLREGFPRRPEHFPWSIILCGLRDVRDYKVASGGDPSRLGTASPFNVKVESSRLGDFSADEVAELLSQHSEQTGQSFSSQAVDQLFELAQGQPWLSNALAREVTEKMDLALDAPINPTHIESAKERLILARETHLDSLVAKLAEPRVRGVLEPVLAGTMDGGGGEYDDDLRYVRDLGLAAIDNPLRIANPIYREVVLRVLAGGVQAKVVADPRSFVADDGRLDFSMMLREFADFWRQHGDVLVVGVIYHEVAPQLVLMAYLQRVVNGGGYVEREVGIGSGRIDVCVRWPFEAAGKRQWQQEALELKVWAPDKADPLKQGLAQLEKYLDKLGLSEGTLVIFDRRDSAEPIEERTCFDDAVTPKGYKVTVLRA